MPENLRNYEYDKDKYTIICTQYTFGQIIEAVEKYRVKNECEKLQKMFSNNKINDKNTYVQIEVVNNNTGEIREYWNNHENKIQF